MSLSPDVRRVIVTVAAVIGAVFLTWRMLDGTQIDLRVYLLGADALLDGKSPYDSSITINNKAGLVLPFTYSPFAAVVLIPFALLPLKVTLALWSTMCIASLAGIAYLTAQRLPGLAGKKYPAWATWEIAAVILAVAAFAEPIRQNLEAGQVNLMIIFVVMYDTANRTKYAGFATGMATGFKVLPGIFIVFMLVTRRWADFGRAMLGFASTLVIGSFFGINNVWQYWTSELFKTERVGELVRTSNLSLRGITSRAFGTDAGTVAWIAVGTLIVVGGFTIAVMWWNRSRLVAATIVGLVSLLISPISWPHHWVWLVPAISVCAALSYRAFRSQRSGIGWLLATAVVVAMIPPMIQLRMGMSLVIPAEWFRVWVIGTAYAAGCVLLLLALGVAGRLVEPELQIKEDSSRMRRNDDASNPS
ncbi:MAG: glycosyltransferase 87 family protein, partial [Candidatus Nanopelagicales bacterium]